MSTTIEQGSVFTNGQGDHLIVPGEPFGGQNRCSHVRVLNGAIELMDEYQVIATMCARLPETGAVALALITRKGTVNEEARELHRKN